MKKGIVLAIMAIVVIACGKKKNKEVESNVMKEEPVITTPVDTTKQEDTLQNESIPAVDSTTAAS